MKTRHGSRGLTTAASLVVVFAGFLVAAGTFYSATANSAERIRTAGVDQHDRSAALARADISIASASWDVSHSDLTLTVNNSGEQSLDAAEIDTVVDGTYVGFDDYERVEVDGRQTTIWRPGEQLVIVDEDTIRAFPSDPEQVKIVTGNGIADRATVVDE